MSIKELTYNFSSKNFILTGAGKGIGFATLKKLYDANANIAVITRSQLDVKKIRKKFSAKRVLSFCGDVSLERDRITFQKQIWQFNEMTSIIKIMFNNFLYHKKFVNKVKYNPSEVRFTKVLTKYSTEFNNYTFIVGLCQNLNMDFKDLLTFFYELKNLNKSEEELNYIFENQNISKLDINRIYRYIEKFTNYDLNEE